MTAIRLANLAIILVGIYLVMRLQAMRARASKPCPQPA